ncbi:MAG: threonine transporter [Microcoleus sp. PH2017_29_MFU_D_A]|jgi:hypothetical protein|uniref:ABC-three component system middle component 2 n=1 Tax=unclassified Microcoleus TaxID=2642155 RepID=UPI001DD9C0D1|nr:MULTISPECIES: ABC-three component system middle component 2 [unclassified Microcoleus]MCC3456244.1 threonine transporter [Microcoleus sp. PH2017_08_TRC_O_A]MCC3508287.1 threonine transporter [Microcoleus sp. PH2017_17_BER_D_A]MCC3605712.1 threonine transporter [Microcoleus sp. PH2017_29_MFU_D_A]MCC3637224.1 threonine transporter [Microcoleus sp. PH2017_37_MFU_D_B]
MTSPFNSPLETGIRTLAILTAVYPRSLDLQHLVYFDYLALHSGDAEGPESLHTPLPLRSGELTVRRGLIERGIFLMMSRQLVERLVSSEGFQYIATDTAGAFLSMMSSQYISKLKERAEWVAETFSESTLEELQALERRFFREWSTQFNSIDSPGGQGI